MTLKDIEKKLANNESVTITFVGDSVTYGEIYSNADETYVGVFAKKMAEKYPEATVWRYDGIVTGELLPLCGYKKVKVSEGKCGKIHIIRSGVGGNTITRARRRVKDYVGTLPSGTHSDFIITMFGINDSLAYDKTKYTTADEFYENYDSFIKMFYRMEKADLILMSATTSDQFMEDHIQKTYEIAKAHNLSLIDLNKLWREHYKEGDTNFGHGDWLSPGDPYHPTTKAAKIMGEKVFCDFLKIVR